MIFKKFRHLIIGFLLFVSVFLVYKFIYPSPRNWYDHYRYLAKSFIQLRVDIPNLPNFYQDKVTLAGKTYLPFPPMPAVILIPFILLFKGVSQQSVSILLGAVNVSLVYFLLKKFTSSINSFLLSIFFAFGTVHFWSSVVGTTWYFAHTVAVLFLLLSLISHFKKWDYLSGLFFAFAALSRYPILAGGIFYLLMLIKSPRRLLVFLAGASVFVPINLIYNYLRFGSILQMGYYQIYQSYVNLNYPVTILKLVRPDIPIFGYIDIRNIPLHLFTFLIIPPIIAKDFIVSPSPYGMGIIFSTPLLLIALWPKFKTVLERNLFIGASFVALVDFLHYAQGWVQFGYRFLLDFLPFLLIILALRFKPKKFYLLLLAVSIAVNFWGTKMGIALGW